MNIKTILLLPLLLSATSVTKAFDKEEEPVPSIELVTTIFDYCVTTNEDTVNKENELKVLACVNQDLDVSTYQLFNSYQAIVAYISSTEE